jgi:WD40 repeat protein
MSDQSKYNPDFYVVGGTMKPDAPSYIQRKADRELYEHILKGDFCCVLTPRQMGKSSLMARTANRLKKEGMRTAIIDLTQIGTEKEKTSADKWYYGIAYRIIRELDIKIKLSNWWQEREKLPALQRLTEFFEDVLLSGTHEPVVIFVDEIDTTIALPFTDDFFAAVRACYNARAAKIEYQRLNFVLLGVATPSDLIKDTQRTPFNIGHGIHLTDFTLEEAKPLSLGLCADPEQGEKMLARILYWTGGHPYLTQKLCGIAAHEKLGIHSDEEIDNFVEKNFLSPGINRQEPNLKFVSDRLLQDRKNSRKRLKLYRRIYNKKPVLDDTLSPIHASLKLSGLVLPGTKQWLSIRNRIYEKSFTGEWIKEVIPIDWNRNIAVAAAALLLIGVVIYFTLLLPELYINEIRTAQEDVPIDAYKKLKGIPFYETTADNLFAGYWQRRALRSVSRGNQDEGLIYLLKALTIKESAICRSGVEQLIGDDYKNLLVTYRLNSPNFSVAISPDGKTALTWNGFRAARLWEVDTGKPVSSLMKNDYWVSSAAFSPNGRNVVTGSYDGTIRLWDAATGKPVSPPMRQGRMVTSVTFSPDGKIVLAGDDDGTVRLWDAATGKPVAPPIKHSSRVSSVAFSPYGKTVLTGSYDGTARLWDAATGISVSPPMKHDFWVLSVAFSPDGKSILTGSWDGTARLWHATTGKPVSPPMIHGGRVSSVAFSPDGKTTLTGSLNGTENLLDTNTRKLLAILTKLHTSAYSGAVNPDVKIIIAYSNWRIHQSILADGKLKPKASRLLPGEWTGAHRFLDDRGDKMQVAVRVTGDSIKIINLRFDKSNAPPIQGDPSELLDLWQKKLALRLDEETGKIEPMYPLPEVKNDIRRPSSVIKREDDKEGDR